MSLVRDLSVSAVAAGFVTVLVGFASSAVICRSTTACPSSPPGRRPNQRESALVTFLVTASGVSLAGVGSAFWGLVAGVMTLVILRAAAGRS